MKITTQLTITAVLGILFFQSAPCIALESSRNGFTRAIWVERWNYENPQDIEDIISICAKLYFNTILFQVRDKGTVCYPSIYEQQDFVYRAFSSSWDPLQQAIEIAHNNDIELHAWINVYKGWSGPTEPDSNHHYYCHPSWFMYNQYGGFQTWGDGYLWFSPTHPQVSDHITKLCSEIVTDYDVDGLHLDYIRFPGNGYSYDIASLREFRRVFGATPQEQPENWTLYRRRSITNLLRKIYQDIKRRKPHIVVSAAVIGHLDRGRDLFLQESSEWLAEGVVDAVYPMLYEDDSDCFRRNLESFLENSHGRYIYPGINSNNNRLLEKFDIVDEYPVPGSAIFSYHQLFNHSKEKHPLVNFLLSYWMEPIPGKSMDWKMIFRDDHGPAISQLKTLPSPLLPGQPFRVAAQIKDPSGIYNSVSAPDSAVVLVYDTAWPPENSTRLTLSKIENTQHWYITDDYATSPRGGTTIYCRIQAYDNYYESVLNPERNLGLSDVTPISVVQLDSTYISAGEFGPELWYPSDLETDSHGYIWINSTVNGPVIIMNNLGEPADYSPIQQGLSGRYQPMPVKEVIGFARGAFNTMIIACNCEPPMLFRFNMDNGSALPGIELPFPASSVASDSLGRFYIVDKQSSQWWVLSPTGERLTGGPFETGGSAIAVLRNGAIGFIADASSNSVETWYGAVEGKYCTFGRRPNLNTLPVGFGTLTTNGAGNVFVCHSDRGLISIHNKAGDLLGHILGGEPPMIAPKAIALSPYEEYLYLIEAVGKGPTKVRKWMKRN